MTQTQFNRTEPRLVVSDKLTNYFESTTQATINKLTMPKKKAKKAKTPWQIAKPILQENILNGTIGVDWTYQRVYTQIDPRIQEVPYINFRQNFRNLRESLAADGVRASRDMVTFEKTCKEFPVVQHPHFASDPRWEGSEAQAQLRIAIEEGLHKQFPPRVLKTKHEAFHPFKLETFRQHIHQEIGAQRRKEFNMMFLKKGGGSSARTAGGAGGQGRQEEPDDATRCGQGKGGCLTGEN